MLDLHLPADAVARASQLAAQPGRPVVLADTQDNPGAGGNGDATGMLKAWCAARPRTRCSDCYRRAGGPKGA